MRVSTRLNARTAGIGHNLINQRVKCEIVICEKSSEIKIYARMYMHV